jgi:hypothetical protein
MTLQTRVVAVEPDGPDNDQYWAVAERLRATMPDAHIANLYRIQNRELWYYYSFHKKRFGNINIPLNERHVWHGTSTLDPAVIYNDLNDGFMTQCSSDRGFWG